ncbi:MAG: Ppx/GppA family phosphatase, partial [Actinobacteria bacterium]|nr:Ppx/GppA family phosphatase [Actinomycetota bacterium]
IGGGSTEVVLGSAELGADGIPVTRIKMAHSFDIGSRRVRDLFLRSDPPTLKEIEEADAWIVSEMQPYFRQFPKKPEKIIAVAGTATSLVSIDRAMDIYDSERVHGAELRAETVSQIAQSLAAMPLTKRRKVCGLEPERADVIVAGVIILQVVLRLAGLSACTVSESDILQGILLDASRDL